MSIDFLSVNFNALDTDTITIKNYLPGGYVDGVYQQGAEEVIHNVRCVIDEAPRVLVRDLNIDPINSKKITITTGDQAYQGRRTKSENIEPSIITIDGDDYRVVQAENYHTMHICNLIVELIQ